ncbi:MAG: monovalent cation/H+ antiporter subunit A [Rubrivivax sp.]
MLPLIAALPWLGALLLACLPADARRTSTWLAGAVALAVAGLNFALVPAVFGGEVPVWSVSWLPVLGLDLGFRMDGLAWLFVMLIGCIGALVVLYAAWYLDADEPVRRFFIYLLMFMGAMLGIAMADNLLLLVLFWELTSLSSYLLIGWWHADPTDGRDARLGARMALTITGAGGLCLLAGVLLLGEIVGSFQLSAVLAAGDTIRASPLYVTALVLVLLGAFTKSAQFPFHFWLPHAMAAPTPVSAYLHSATMVKAGVFLLARFYPALGGTEEWFWIVSLTGMATMVFGAYAAIFQHDLKGLLAYSTISHLGLITLLFGISEPLAVVAGMFHIINHATFKAGLFMAAGIIDHECGTRDMRRINGMWKVMPLTATLGMIAAAAMAGVPLANGFLTKEMLFAESLAKQTHGAMEWLLPTGALLAATLGIAYSLRFVHDVFFNGDSVDLPRQPHEPPFMMLAPVMLLAALCLAVGIVPSLTAGPVLAVAAQAALYGTPGPALPAYSLALWHGFNLPLLMSGVAVVAGIGLYVGLQRFINLHRLVTLPGWFAAGGRELFHVLLGAGVAAARGITGLLQNGSLQRYLLLLVLMALAAGAWPLWSAPLAWPALHLRDLNVAVALVGTVGIVAALATTVMYRKRLIAVVMMGATGLVVCLTFAWFSAPDLALTQLLVEVVMTALMMLALRWLPDESAPERHVSATGQGLARLRWIAWRDGVIALACGLGMAALTWQLLNRPASSISDYFLQTARSLGGGSNVVNVILVDYRAFDTLGEITVLAIAALTIRAVLTGWQPRLPPTQGYNPLMPQLVARLVLPLALLVSVHLFLRGHNLPGGGFIAGLVLALALVLQPVAHGNDWAEARLGGQRGRSFNRWMARGLLLAVGTGVASFWFGAPFMTSTYDYPWLPGVGGVPLASASAFDLGVFMVVVGSTLAMLMAMARLSSSGSR